MNAIITTPEDVVNAALVRIGYQDRIGSIFEGSAASKAALDIYGQTRDDMLRVGNWGFARRDVTLTLLKSAPAGGYATVAWSNIYPPLPWQYEYTYPDDCLKVRAIRAKPLFIPDFDPHPAIFDTPNDTAYSPARKVIVGNVADAICTYTGQITNPATWESSFAEALIDRIAELLAPTFNPQAFQAAAAQEQIAEAKADVTQG